MLIYLRQGDAEGKKPVAYRQVMIHVRDQLLIAPTLHKFRLSLVIIKVLTKSRFMHQYIETEYHCAE